MTLNITAITAQMIYQSADYRLTDLKTGRLWDFETAKIVFVHGERWAATVCFAGIGLTSHGLNIGDWLGEQIRKIVHGDPFDRLLDLLMDSEAWLSPIPEAQRVHSFSVGAFIGQTPTFALVTTVQSHPRLTRVSGRGCVTTYRQTPAEPHVHIAGQSSALSRPLRRRLLLDLNKQKEQSRAYELLVNANKSAARVVNGISPACFVTHLDAMGRGGGMQFGADNQPITRKSAPFYDPEMLSKIPGFHPGVSIRQFAFARSEPTEEYHAAQLKEKPNDPDRLSNYAAFLIDVEANLPKAESVLEQSLRTDPKHVLSRLNLGYLREKQGDFKRARVEYEAAIEIAPTNELVSWNLSLILEQRFVDVESAAKVVERGFAANPSSSRLAVRRMYLSTKTKDLDRLQKAIGDAESVVGVEQAEIVQYRALLLHWRHAPVGDRIAAWQAAAALWPDAAAFKLNLAQLLYLRRDDATASTLLAAALRLGLGPAEEAEAQVYRLCHSDAPPRLIAADVSRLLEKGGRLDWDVQANVDQAKRENPMRGKVAEVFVAIMRGERSIEDLAVACAAFEGQQS